MSLRTLADLPAPKGLPLVGNALQLDPLRMHQILEDWAAAHGPMYTFRIGRKRTLAIADPALIQQMLRERPDNYRRYSRIEPVFAEMGLAGLIPAEGEHWRRQRRIWIASLNAAQVKPFMPQLAEVTDRLRRRWLRSTGAPLDVRADLQRFTVDVGMRFALGHDPNTLEHDGEDQIQNHLQSIFPMTGRRMNAPLPYWRWFRLPIDRKLDRDLEALRARIGGLIAEARRRLAQDPGRKPASLLEALLAARDEDGSQLSDTEVYSNAVTALLAGEDTTASSLAWIMHYLAARPDVQQRLREEADRVLGGSILWTDHARGEDLRYADAVMAETLRLRPPAPAMAHTTVRDVELGGVTIPAGTDIFAVVRTPARSAEHFAQPDEFRPERWLDQPALAHVQRPPTPFGGGARICPGRAFASAEIKSVVAMLARNFSLAPAAGPGPVTELLSFAMEPVNLRVRLQARAASAALDCAPSAPR